MTAAQEIRNVPASVRQRVLNHARALHVDFNLVLRSYAESISSAALAAVGPQ